MKIRDLVSRWEDHSSGKSRRENFSLRLSKSEVAGITALAELYPEFAKEYLAGEIFSAALHEMVESFSYVKGERIICRDESDEPIYEDVGLTSKYLAIKKKYLDQYST